MSLSAALARSLCSDRAQGRPASSREMNSSWKLLHRLFALHYIARAHCLRQTYRQACQEEEGPPGPL